MRGLAANVCACQNTAGIGMQPGTRQVQRESTLKRATAGLRRRAWLLAGIPIVAAAAIGLGHPTQALAASSSSSVGYLKDTSTGSNSLWVDGFGISNVADGGSYSTVAPAPSATVTIHNVSMTTLDTPSSTALANLDTLVVFDVCDMASHLNAMKAINTFLDGGGKILLLDGAWCTDGNGGTGNWSAFEKSFTDSYAQFLPQHPAAASGQYSPVESSALTTGLPDCTPTPCNEPGDVLSNALTLNPTSTGWCEALGGTDSNNGATTPTQTVTGAIMAYNRNNASSGLVLYEGEPFTLSNGTTATAKHLRLVFDDMLAKTWNPDGLSCSNPVSPQGTIAEAHFAIFAPVIGFVLMGGLMLAMVGWRRRRQPAA